MLLSDDDRVRNREVFLTLQNCTVLVPSAGEEIALSKFVM